MEEISGVWILARLKGKRGEKSRLAAAMGISADRLTKVLTGERKVQSAEIPGVLRFFGISLGPHQLDDLVRSILELPEQKRAEAKRYIEFLKSHQ